MEPTLQVRLALPHVCVSQGPVPLTGGGYKAGVTAGFQHFAFPKFLPSNLECFPILSTSSNRHVVQLGELRFNDPGFEPAHMDL